MKDKLPSAVGGAKNFNQFIDIECNIFSSMEEMV
jgi:hypothetical protein